MFKISPQLKKSLLAYKNEFIKHNFRYRVFTLLVWSIAWLNNEAYFINNIPIFVFGVLPCYFITLYIIDHQFRKYVDKKIHQQRYKADAKQAKLDLIANQNRKATIEVIKVLPKLMLFKSLPYLTQLPILEDHFLDNINHHKYRHLKHFRGILEGDSKHPKIKIIGIDADQYHATFLFTWLKPLTLPRAKKILLKRINKSFGKIPKGTLFKTRKKFGELLLPVEIFKDSQAN